MNGSAKNAKYQFELCTFFQVNFDIVAKYAAVCLPFFQFGAKLMTRGENLLCHGPMLFVHSDSVKLVRGVASL